MTYNQPSLLLMISSVFSLILSLYANRRKGISPAILSLSYMLIAAAVWSVGYGLEQAVVSLEHKKLVDIITYAGITTVPVLWFIFAARYTGRDKWLTPLLCRVFFIIPAITMLLLATNDSHHLFYASVRLAFVGEFSFLDIQRGVYWRLIHMPYSYGLLLAGFVFFVMMFFRLERIHRPKVAVLIAAPSLPLMVNIAYLMGIRPYGYLDLTPISFILTMIIYLFGILKTDLFGMVPVALDTLYNNLPDPVLVLDNAGRVVSSNIAGKKIMASSKYQQHHKLRAWFSDKDDGTIEVLIDNGFHQVSKTHIMDSARGKGSLVVFRNVTLEKNEEKTVRMNEERAVRQRTAITEMVLDDLFVECQVPAVYDRITGILSRAMNVDRASIWLFDEQNTTLTCLSLYEKQAGTKLRDTVVNISYFPHYFQALMDDGIIDAGDAQQDPRTLELMEQYLKPFNITSLLDAGIVVQGRLQGVVSLEHTGPARDWHIDEEAFVSTAAALVAQIFVNDSRKQAEIALRESEAKKTALINSVSDLMFVLDENLIYRECYTPKSELLVVSVDQMIGKHIDEIGLPEPAYGIIKSALVRTLQTGKPTQSEYHIDFQEKRCWFEAHMAMVGEHEDDRKMIMYTCRDITDRKTKETYIEYLSFNDQLTGLYNRRFYDEELNRLDTRRNYPLTLLLVDVNGLKLMNDAFGHQEGDRLLQTVAAAMKQECRSDDIIARVGGDEFVILLPRTESSDAAKLAARIDKSLQHRLISGLPVSVSVGWETKTSCDQEISEIYKMADDRMYQSKISDRQRNRQQIIQLIQKHYWQKIPYAEAHSRQVRCLSGRIGSAMGLSKAEIMNLETAALLHDIGKITISNEIIHKKTALSDKEWMAVKRHPEVSHNILSAVNGYAPLAEVVAAHHEHWNGGGYPSGKSGEDIPLAARIIAVADAFDAMVSDRPYRYAMTREQAALILRNESGRQFDPVVVEVFLELILPVYDQIIEAESDRFSDAETA